MLPFFSFNVLSVSSASDMENVKLITIQEQGSLHSFTKDQKYNFQNIVCLGKPNDTKEVKKN